MILNSLGGKPKQDLLIVFMFALFLPFVINGHEKVTKIEHTFRKVNGSKIEVTKDVKSKSLSKLPKPFLCTKWLSGIDVNLNLFF